MFIPEVIGNDNMSLEVFPCLADGWRKGEAEFNSFDFMRRNFIRAEDSANNGMFSDNVTARSFHQHLAFGVRMPDVGFDEAHGLISKIRGM